MKASSKAATCNTKSVLRKSFVALIAALMAILAISTVSAQSNTSSSFDCPQGMEMTCAEFLELRARIEAAKRAERERAEQERQQEEKNKEAEQLLRELREFLDLEQSKTITITLEPDGGTATSSSSSRRVKQYRTIADYSDEEGFSSDSYYRYRGAGTRIRTAEQVRAQNPLSQRRARASNENPIIYEQYLRRSNPDLIRQLETIWELRLRNVLNPMSIRSLERIEIALTTVICARDPEATTGTTRNPGTPICSYSFFYDEPEDNGSADNENES